MNGISYLEGLGMGFLVFLGAAGGLIAGNYIRLLWAGSGGRWVTPLAIALALLGVLLGSAAALALSLT